MKHREYQWSSLLALGVKWNLLQKKKNDNLQEMWEQEGLAEQLF